jgi:hypothetical protein
LKTAGRIKNNPADRSNNSTDFDTFKRLFRPNADGKQRSLVDKEAGSLFVRRAAAEADVSRSAVSGWARQRSTVKRSPRAFSSESLPRT